MTEWKPIETAPKDGTVVLGFADNKDGTVFLSEIMWCKKNETIIGVTDSVVGPNQWFSLLSSGSVCPTHWMPLPEPPALGEKTDDLVKRLRYDAKKLADDICGEAADRIEELEAALREISDPDNWEGMDWVSYGVPKWIARAALEGRKHNEKVGTGMDA
jgi:hypothetical protein